MSKIGTKILLVNVNFIFHISLKQTGGVMDLILHNGKVYAGRELTLHEAIGITGNKIAAVGTSRELLAMSGDRTKKIDLAGKAVFAGFNDSHMHLLNYGYSRMMVPLFDANSIEDIQARSKKFIEENPAEEGTWIFGRGWNQDLFEEEKVFPTRYDLDKISTKNPLLYYRTCGHIIVLNSKALEVIGVDRNTKQVEGGHFDLDEKGEPLGIFRELAQELVFEKVPTPSIEQIKNMMRRAFKELNAEGITSVGSDDFTAMPDRDYEKVIRAYKELIESGEMTVRVNEQCLLPDFELLKGFYNKGYKTGIGDEFFRIGPLKLLIDGALGARTALLREPYVDAPTTKGIATATQEELNNLVLLAHKNDCQVAIHGIGDAAMDMIFKSIENALSILPRENHRHGIVHAQITDKKLLDQFQSVDALAYIQPIFLDYDWKMVESRIGKERMEGSYDWRGMIDRGIHASMGSDSPVETFSVMAGIYEAVTRKDLTGMPAGGWMADKAITVKEAVNGYTYEGSYASFEENVKGTLEVGRLADMVVLSEDIMAIAPERIKEVKVEMTIMDGKIVYQC